jgi:hypothetical protein
MSPPVAALEAMVKDVPEASELIQQLLTGELIADAYHAAVIQAAELIAPIHFDRGDDPRYLPNAEHKVWIEEAIRLGAAEPEAE